LNSTQFKKREIPPNQINQKFGNKENSKKELGGDKGGGPSETSDRQDIS
jgi:hypothetical protein